MYEQGGRGVPASFELRNRPAGGTLVIGGTLSWQGGDPRTWLAGTGYRKRPRHARAVRCQRTNDESDHHDFTRTPTMSATSRSQRSLSLGSAIRFLTLPTASTSIHFQSGGAH